MFAPLLIALCGLVSPVDDDLADARAAAAADRRAVEAAGDGPSAAADAAFARLGAAADDWEELATQDRSIPAAKALRTLADGGGPYANRASGHLAKRRSAVLDRLKAEGVDTPGGWSPYLPRKSEGSSFERYRILRGGGEGPNPIVRLRLLAPSGKPVFVFGPWRESGFGAADLADVATVPNLTHLSLGKTADLPDDWLDPFREHPTLRDINMSKLSLTVEGCAILAGMPALEGVRLTDCEVNAAALRALGRSRTLHSVTFVRCGVTDAALEGLAALPEVRRLALVDNPKVTDAGVVRLRLGRLELLNLIGTRCGDGALAHAAGRWAPAATLSGSEPRVMAFLQGLAITDAGLEHLAAAPALDRVNLDDTHITGAGFAAWAIDPPRADTGSDVPPEDPYFRDGLRIRCVNCPLTPGGLADLAAVPGLEALTLGGPAVTDAAVAALAASDSLRTLQLKDAPLTGTGFAAFARGAALDRVSLWDCGVTDAGMAAVAAVPRLRRLNVADCERLTDAVWERLAGARRLTDISFYRSPVGGPGLAAFARHRGPRYERRGSDETEVVPLWRAALRFGPRAALHGLTTWGRPPRRAAFRLIDGLARPLPTAAALLATTRREVPAPGPPACVIRLNAVGLTEEVLTSLPRMPVGRWYIERDRIPPEAIRRFRDAQPDAR